MAIKGVPLVQSHISDGMTPAEEYHFMSFNETDRVRAYDNTIDNFIRWYGFSGIGVDDGKERIPIFKELLMYPVLVFASIVLVLFTPARYLYIFIEWIT
jgi:hypothetical protein